MDTRRLEPADPVSTIDSKTLQSSLLVEIFYAGQIKVYPVQHNKFQSDPPSVRNLFIRKILLCWCVCFTFGDTFKH